MNEPRDSRTAVAPARSRRSGVAAATGGTTTVAAVTRIFHVKLRFRNPLTDALVPFPAGLQVLLFNRGAAVGAAVTTDAQGYAAVPFTPAPAATAGAARSLPEYRFVARCPVRSYIDLAGGALVRADALGVTDTRDLFELPLEMDSGQGHFLHDPITGFARGRFSAYAGEGEGAADAPLTFTLNLVWYPLKFQFYNIILRRVCEVPRGMSVQARINNLTYPEAMKDYSFVEDFPASTTVLGRQGRLKWLGFYTGPVDGTQNQALADAITAFQNRHGLPETGIANDATIALLIEAFYNRRVSVMRDNTYLVPVLAKDPAHAAGQVDFKVKQANLWVFTDSDAATPVVQVTPQTDVDALAYPEKFKYYDLPEFWTSEDAFFRRGDDLLAAQRWADLPTDIPCYPTNTAAIPQDNPLIINLDDMVLMRNETHLETVAAGDRYAVFDLMGAVVEEDVDEPYLTMARNMDTNYLACQDGGAFAAYFKGKYYFAHGKRVPAGLRRAGLRAAILNEQPHRAIQEPLVLFAGNLEENFFHAVDFRNDKIISYVMVLWTCKLVRDASTVSAADQATVDQGIIDYKLSGMVNCKLRHEEPDFDVVDKEDVSPQLVKVLKHFVVWNDPAAKCTVHVHNGGGRDNMGLNRASFNAANWQARGGGWASAAGRFTAAHELGHAVGLDDDYIEPPGAWGNAAWGAPVIPRFAQWVAGNPFAGDRMSLMNSNHTYRHRMVFHHVNWMNSTPAILALTGNIKFKAQTPQHNYYLPPPADRNFLTAATKHIHYTPVLSAAGFANGTTGHMDLILYKIGRDQTPREIVAGKDFDGILCVSLYIKWAFHDVSTATWTTVDKMNWIKAKYGALATLVNQKKYLGTTAADSTHFEKIYIQFRLHFHEGANGNDNVVLLGSGHISPHFTVNAYRTHATTAAHTPSYHTAGFTARTLDVDETSDPTPWFRYMLGLTPVTIEPGPPQVVTETTTVENADLEFLRTWANTTLGAANLGSNYTVQDF